MNVGTALFVVRDVVALLVNKGVLHPDGTFDQALLNSVTIDLSLASGVEAVLKFHGVHTPDKVDKIIQLLPLLSSLIF